MRKKLFANWGIKLISLLAAFGLWFTVVYFEDPPGKETFTNIPVQFVNTEILTDQGLVYEVLDNTDVVKRVTVTGPGTVLADMTADSIIATADFSEKNMSDVIQIKFTAVNQYSGVISEITPSEDSTQLKLFVEEKISRSVPLNVKIVGDVAEGCQLGTAKTDQNRVTVTGGKSKVEQVSYAAAVVDVTGADMDISTTEIIRLYDKDDNLLDTNLVQKNINSTRTSVAVLATKTVPVEFEITGNVAEGYLLTGAVEQNLDSLLIAGYETVLSGIESIRLPEDLLDVTGLTEDLAVSVNLRNYLPSGVQIAKEGGDGNLEITVRIEPEITLDLKLISENISFVGLPEGVAAVIEEPYTVYDVQAAGLQENISRISEPDLRGNINVAAWMEEQEISTENAGSLIGRHYYLPVDLLLPEGVTVTADVEARVTFRAAESTVQ